jgi:Putative Flp pilus-assembly TadE/G-like
MLRSKPSRERGMTIPLLAMFIVVLFAVAALAIDVGLFYTARTSAQHVADAAALAGAFTFLDLKNTQPAAAIDAATAVARANTILGEPATIDASNVAVDVANRRVSVTVPRLGAAGISTFFARVLRVDTVDVQTQATAETSKYASASHCLKPIAVTNTALSDNSTSIACAVGETIFDGQGNVTSFAMSRFGRTAITLDSEEDHEHSTTGAKYVPLDFGGNADNYAATFSYCLNEPECGADTSAYGCTTPLSVRNHLDPQETFLGVEQLIGPNPDRWGGPGPNGGFQYLLSDQGGVASDTSVSLGAAPVWDNCTTPVPGYTVQPIGFVQLFFERAEAAHGEITARLVSANACGPYKAENGTGPYAVPVRLVQRPQFN